MLDTDIIIDFNTTIKPLILARKEKYNSKMLCSNINTIVPYPEYVTNNLKDNLISYNNSEYLLNFYYDSFALNYGEYFFEKDMIDIMDNLFSGKKYLEVKTALMVVYLF